MSLSLREKLKRLAPRPARMAVRKLLERPGVETVALKTYAFVPDPDPRPRLSFVLPSLSRRDAFGGVQTGLDFFLKLGRRVDELGVELELRVVSEEHHDRQDTVLPAEAGIAEVHALRPNGWQMPTRRHELFLGFNWYVTLNLEPILAGQSATFKRASFPKIFIMQDYEPGFYPFSPAHVLAREACNDGPAPLWLVLNGRELADYYRLLGNRASRLHVFEPRMAPALRARRHGLDISTKRRQILVYGRPGIDRNCYTILIDGLRRWSADTRAAADWQLVSAGVPHADVQLAAGRRLHSLGKLSLDAYGDLLRATAVGVALMASPHPSYPPLEMAHFGVRTITNRFVCKDPPARHENLLPLDRMRGADLARLLEATVLAFEREPDLGLRARSFMPDYLSDAPYECLDALAADIAGLLKS